MAAVKSKWWRIFKRRKWRNTANEEPSQSERGTGLGRVKNGWLKIRGNYVSRNSV